MKKWTGIGHRKGTWWGVAWIMIGLLACRVYADVQIVPAYVEVQLDKGRPAGRFMVSNLGDNEERYRINAVHFTYTEIGGLVQSETGEHSLAPWIHFNPRELVMPPKSQRAVRFAVVPQGQLKPGEYWVSMELENLQIQEIQRSDPNGGKNVTVKAISAIVVPIFGSVGRVNYTSEIRQVEMVEHKGKRYLSTLVAATGTGRIGATGQFQILDRSGKVWAQSNYGKGYILRDSQRRFTKEVDPNLPEGDYQARVTFTAPHLDVPLVKVVEIHCPKIMQRIPQTEPNQVAAGNPQGAGLPLLGQ